MSPEYEADGYDETDDEDFEEDLDEDKPWESFGIDEAEWVATWKRVQHANIDTETVAELFLACFPTKTEAALAYACFLVLSEDLEE